jgi:cytochrome c oxidase subunit 2
VLAVALFGLFTTIALVSRESVPLERVQQVGYRLRRGWLVLLAMLGVATVGTSMFFLPYAEGGRPHEIVKVTGGQFYWSMSRPTFEQDTRLRFDVTSADVNHGFGIYDPDGEMIGSVQAMPGYHNQLDITLSKRGRYLVACLEFCGIDHHRMIRNFEVVPKRQ